MGAGGSVLDDESRHNNLSQQPNRAKVTTSTVTQACPTFTVALSFWPGNRIPLPDNFKLRISYESLDFVGEDDTPLVQFPFQNIICWGSSPQNFQFKVFDFAKSEAEKRDSGILISLKTHQGKTIEDATMSNVQRLMADMAQAVSKAEFAVLLAEIFDEKGQIRENWMSIIDQFTSSGRKFLAKQGMELLQRIGSQAPFEKFDLACLVFERLINPNSVQLLINTFEDQQDRENIIHRLHLNRGDKKVVVSTCAILPEHPVPVSPQS